MLTRPVTLAAAAAAALTCLALTPNVATATPAPAPAVTTSATPTPAAASTTTTARKATYKATLRAATKNLPATPEHRDGYDRDLYKHWIDADSDGCDTRDEVLIAEATTTPTVSTGCTLTGGAWFSYYDEETTTDPSGFDIDHMVPLAESWDSGAYLWTADTRTRYANDLSDKRALVAVTASSNRSKSDQDPAEWTPDYGTCRYLKEWVAIKTRWGLSVDATEKKYLLTAITECPATTIKVTRAKVETTGNPDNTTDPTPNDSTGLTLTRIDYNPAGTDDDTTTNKEIVVITNTSDKAVELADWTLTDAAAHTYTLPDTHIARGGIIRVHSGPGTTDHTYDNAFIWLYADWGHIWNNTGTETATLTQPNGTVADTCTYTGDSTGTIAC